MILFIESFNYTKFFMGQKASTVNVPEFDYSDRMYVRKEGQYWVLDNEIYPCRFEVSQEANTSSFIKFKILDYDYFSNVDESINMRFKLWEDKYDDYVLPGKIEKINITTGMRNAEYYIDKDPDIEIIKLDAKYQRKLLELFTKPNDMTDDEHGKLIYEELAEDFVWDKNHTIGITFERTSISDTLCYLIWCLRWWKFKTKTYFKPMQFNPLPLGARGRDWEFANIRDLGPEVDFTKTIAGVEENITRFLVYSKLKPDTIYFVNEEREAQVLLAELKFGNSIPLLPCGLSVFEDYYYMNISKFRNMNINYDNEVKIELYNPTRGHRNFIQGAKNLYMYIEHLVKDNTVL